MNDALTEALCEEFTGLFAGRAKPATDSSMCLGSQCGDGWFTLLPELSSQLTGYAQARPYFRREAVEVNGKAGNLRFELSFATDWTDACTEAARRRARATCELIGKPG